MFDVPRTEAASTPENIFLRYARSLFHLLGNRRRFERVRASGMVRVSDQGYTSITTHMCCCVDISIGGIAVDSPEPLMPNTVAELQVDGCAAKRRVAVRYCNQHATAYRIGLTFISDSEQMN